MGSYKVDSNVPINPEQIRFKYPFKTMKVGESFEFTEAKRRAVRASATRYKTLNPDTFNYSSKQVGPGVFRLWRIEVNEDEVV